VDSEGGCGRGGAKDVDLLRPAGVWRADFGGSEANSPVWGGDPDRRPRRAAREERALVGRCLAQEAHQAARAASSTNCTA
jgi:hypothetical protein